jgi:DNA polymerase-1
MRIFYGTLKYFNPVKIIMPYDDYIGNSFRRKIDPEYKTNRKEKNTKDPFNEDFKRQKEIILKIIEKSLPVYTLKYKGYEADDLIAMICKIASNDVNIVVWSNDRDLVQLQQKFRNVRIWNPRTKNFFNNPGYDLVLYKSLVGDRSDNIKGVGGIGHKTAAKVMNSQTEFIKHVARYPEKFIKFRKNKKIIDLIDNDLLLPENLDYILNKNVEFDIKMIEEIIENNDFKSLRNNINDIKDTFMRIVSNNNNNTREWFFDKGSINGS